MYGLPETSHLFQEHLKIHCKSQMLCRPETKYKKINLFPNDSAIKQVKRFTIISHRQNQVLDFRLMIARLGIHGQC